VTIGIPAERGLGRVTLPRHERYDTVVVGAGPAGIMAAMHAAERGSVLLLDASSLPRDKSCGGMLHGLSIKALAPYGEVPESIIASPRHVRFRYVDWDRGIRRPTDLPFLNVDRAGFDDWLVSLLPPTVEVLGSCPLLGFRQDAGGVDVDCRVSDRVVTLHCANLVGADGARSAVRRALGAGATSTYVTLQDFVELKGDIEPFFDCIYARQLGDSFGYGYIVPKDGHALVGSVFYPRTTRPWEKADRLLELMRAAMPQLGASVKREACAALYLRSTSDVVPGAGRVLLAGEAGGFMSPSSGEGISYALRSGIEAGRAIAGRSPAEALDAYAAAVAPMRADTARRLRWLPLMESKAGKYVAGFVPTAIVSRITQGL
jgi:flavin-dependent dehydrogenase